MHEFLTFILITLLVWADWGLVVGPLNSGFLACILGKTHGTRLSSFSQGLVFWSRRRVNICVKSSLLKCLVGSHPALPNDTKFNHLFRLLMYSLCISSRNETLGSPILISCFVIHEQNAGVGQDSSLHRLLHPLLAPESRSPLAFFLDSHIFCTTLKFVNEISAVGRSINRATKQILRNWCYFNPVGFKARHVVLGDPLTVQVIL